MFFHTDRPTEFRDPHFTEYIKLVGRKNVYTYEDIEKLSTKLSKTKATKILALKPGKEMLFNRYSRNADLMVRVLTQDQVDLVNEYQVIDLKRKKILSDIKIKCAEEYKQMSELESKQRKIATAAMKLKVDVKFRS